MKNNIIYMKLEEIKPYENNPRHNDGAVKAVAESIRNFGFNQPIVVDKNNVIIVGHTRWKAAKQLGLQEVPVLKADNLTDEQANAYRLADNKTGELAEWNFEKLEEELENFSGSDIDMTDFGFTIEDLFGGAGEEEGEAAGKKENGYSIVYEIAFNNEEEQEQWYDFLSQLKEKFPYADTISERILLAVKEWQDEQ